MTDCNTGANAPCHDVGTIEAGTVQYHQGPEPGSVPQAGTGRSRIESRVETATFTGIDGSAYPPQRAAEVAERLPPVPEQPVHVQHANMLERVAMRSAPGRMPQPEVPPGRVEGALGAARPAIVL